MSDGSVREHQLLVLAPSGRDAVLASQVLEQGGVSASTCASADELIAAIEEGAGGALIAQEALTPAIIARLAGTLRRQPPWSDFPLIIFMPRSASEFRKSDCAGGVRRPRQRDRAGEADPSADDVERGARGDARAQPPVRGARGAGTTGARRQAARPVPGASRPRAAQSARGVAKRIQAGGTRCAQRAAARETARHHRSADRHADPALSTTSWTWRG